MFFLTHVPLDHTFQYTATESIDRSYISIKVGTYLLHWQLTWAIAGFCGRITLTILKRNDIINDALITKAAIKSSSILGTDLWIQTIQTFKRATTVQSIAVIMWIVCLVTCIGVQMKFGRGPYHTLIKSTKPIMPIWKVNCK